MNLNKLNVQELIKLIDSSVELKKLRKYNSKDVVEKFLPLSLSRTGFYGILNTGTNEVSTLLDVITTFDSDEDVTILIEGIKLLDSIPVNNGTGDIVYTGFGVLEVNGSVIYDGRSSNASAEWGTITGDVTNQSEFGAPLGFATLDASGKLPSSQLTVEAMEYKGAWNANTNTPALIDGTGDIGDVYKVNVAGTQDLGGGSVDYKVGDLLIYNGAIWELFSHSAIGGSTYLYSNSFFVHPNAIFGTGIEGDINNPFTISEAITVASAGDTIYFTPGSYNITGNLAKNGVKLATLGEGKVFLSSITTMFDDLGQPVQFSMEGDFVIVGGNPVPTFNFSNAISLLNIDINEINSCFIQIIGIGALGDSFFNVKKGSLNTIYFGTSANVHFNLGVQTDFVFSDRGGNFNATVKGIKFSATGNLIQGVNSDVSTSIVEFKNVKLVSGRHTILKRAWANWTFIDCDITANGSDGTNQNANCLFTTRSANQQPIIFIDCILRNTAPNTVTTSTCIYWSTSSLHLVKFKGSTTLYIEDMTRACMQPQSGSANIHILDTLCSNVNPISVTNLITGTNLIVDPLISI